jgi:hypothetical protein
VDAYQPYGNSGEGEGEGSVHSGISNLASDPNGSAVPTPRQLSRLHVGRKAAASKATAQTPAGTASGPVSGKGGDSVPAAKLTEKSLKAMDHPSIPKHMRTITEDSLEYRLADFSRPSSRGGNTPLKMSARSAEGSPNLDAVPYSPEGPGQPTSPFATQADLAGAIVADGVTGVPGGGVGSRGKSGVDPAGGGAAGAGVSLLDVFAGVSTSTEPDLEEDGAPLLNRSKRLIETSSLAGKEAAAATGSGGLVPSPNAAAAANVGGPEGAAAVQPLSTPAPAAGAAGGSLSAARTASAHLPPPEHLLLQIPETGPLSPLDRAVVSEPVPSRDPSSSGPSLIRSSTSNTPRPRVGSNGATGGSGASSSSGGGGSSKPVRPRVPLASGQKSFSVEGASALGHGGFPPWNGGMGPPGYGSGGRSGAPSPSPLTSTSPASGMGAVAGAMGPGAGVWWGPGGAGASVLPSPATTRTSAGASGAAGAPSCPDEAVAAAAVGAGVCPGDAVINFGDLTAEQFRKASQTGRHAARPMCAA